MDGRETVVRDVPTFVWIFGLGFFGLGLYLFFNQSAPWFIGAIFILVGAALVAFVPIVTIRVDRGGGMLEIEKRSLTLKHSQEMRVSEIKSVYVDQSVSRDDGSTSYTYRVVIVKNDGEQLPLRSAFSSGRRKKVQQADAIRQIVGVGGSDEFPVDAGTALAQAFALNPIEDQERQTGIPAGEQETNGVRWKLEAFQFGGAGEGSPVYRWSSMDFETPGYFVYLAQRVEGVGKQKGLMNLVGNLLIKQSIRMYGFDEYYAPGWDNAVSMEDVDRRLVENYFVYTSDPLEARRLLNPWTVMPLVGWADRYALDRRSRQFHQMTVLFSSLGVYVSVLNTLDRAQVDELVALGVELVRAQGG